MRKVLLLVFLFVSLNGLTQTFTFSFQRASLARVFAQIEQRSDYRFLYSEEVLALGNPVSFTVNNAPLDSILRLCFYQQPLGYSMEGKHIIVRKKIIEKPVPLTRELRGKVVNTENEPLAGITINIKQSGMAMATDVHGEFYFMNLPAKATLLVTGGEIVPQELEASPNSYQLIVVQQRMSVLDETIVIAYGKTTKRLSTSSQSSITHEEIGKQPVSNPILSLQGRISGLQIKQASGAPGSQVLIQLRGRNSIANGNTPLIILDGVPFPSTTLNNALGGVASYSSPLDNINPSDIERIDILKDADATAIYGSRGANGVILITTKKASTEQTRFFVKLHRGAGAITRKMELMSTSQYLAMRREAFVNDGTAMTNSNAPDLLLWDTTRYTDWQEQLIGKTVHQTTVNFGVSGVMLYKIFVSGGYYKETTVFPGDFGSEKINGSLSLNHQSQDGRFAISLSGSYLINNNTLPREDVSRRITLAPNAPKLYLPSGALNWENSTWINPMSFLERWFNNKTHVFNSTLSISYKISKWLQAKISNGYSRQYLKEHGITPQKSFNPATISASSATFGRTELQTLITEPQLLYNWQVKQHAIDAVAGMTIQQTDQQNLQQTGTGYSSDALLYSIQAASTVSTTIDRETRYRYTGQFARIGYQYARKYLATVTARRDGSSRYGPGGRFANFYSAGLGWVFSKEIWLQKQQALSFGKLRMSWGRSGNDQIGDYRYLDLYSPYTNAYQSVTPFYPTQLFNPSFSWEEVTKREFGIDLGFLKDRFQLTGNYYHNITRNQLIQYPLPTTTGFSGVLKNLPATIRNTGWEIELSGTLIKKARRNWSFSANLTVPRNKLVRFDGLSSSSYANSYVIGQSLNISKRFGFNGVNPATGVYTFIDYDNNNQLGSPQDEQKIVDGSQFCFGGFQQNLVLGRFTVSCLIQFVRQPYAPNYLVWFSRPGSLSNQPVYVMNRWQKPGDESTIQRYSVSNTAANNAYGYYQFSDAGFSDASYIRLRNLYIAFDALTQSMKKIGIKQVNLFLQGHNLFTITSYKGLDPETQTFLPPVKLFSAGMEINF
ncbi:MAG: SusC/RagA family TonB-linked outer membrane protein [Chitinophagaceae bacterium]|nr:SusC/RagA family TonB-linked outer membrane protein [Chitinophagaceae bacterium]